MIRETSPRELSGLPTSPPPLRQADLVVGGAEGGQRLNFPEQKEPGEEQEGESEPRRRQAGRTARRKGSGAKRREARRRGQG